MTCHRLTVPVDREALGGPVLELAVVVVHSTAAVPAPDPVVVIHGGPGGSLTDDLEAWLHPASPLLASRDVVLVDQRGSGRSTPSLDCTDGETLDDCHTRLSDTGNDLSRFGSRDQALDMADLRHRLGYERWNVYAVSFGTRVALQLIDLDPSGTRAAVLDSVYPPDVEPGIEQATNAAAAIEAALDTLERIEALDRLLAELDETVVQVTWTDDAGHERTEGATAELFAGRLFRTLYETGRAGDVRTAVDHAAAGDLAAAFASLGIPTAAGQRGPTSGELSDGAYWAAECHEGIGRSTPEQAVAAAEGRLAETLVRAVVESIGRCDSWRTETAAPTALSATDVPVFLLGGALDPVTPLRWAHDTAAALGPSAVVVEVPGAGHAPSFALSCAEELVVGFLDDPGSAISGDRCG